MNKHILILGAYGLAGRCCAGLLLDHYPAARLTLAGRRAAQAAALAAELQQQYPQASLTPLQLDAADGQALRQALHGVDLLLVASSTLRHVAVVAQAALDAGVDYFDLQLSSPPKIQLLESLRASIEARGLTFITDGGFHPGIPAAMIRLAAQQLPGLTQARVYSAIRSDWRSVQTAPTTAREMVEEFGHFSMRTLRGGTWTDAWAAVSYDFPSPYGTLSCSPMWLEELRPLPAAIPSLRDMGFFISGFNPLTDNLILPLIFMGMKVAPRLLAGPLARLFRWGLGRSRPPYGVHLIAEGRAGDRTWQMRLYHRDEYVLTAAPAVACLMQYFDQAAPSPGLWYQALYVEPTRFFADCAEMGIEVAYEAVGV
ncbi:MAG: hypothetical protein OHK0039_33240 [Bacteroidia bacterium]